MVKNFEENSEGVHLMNPNNDEFSMCGDAQDIDSVTDRIDGNLKAFRPTSSTTVTCRRCIAVIECCHGVKFKA